MTTDLPADAPTELHLFAGSGIGMLAAHHAGIRTVAWCENDSHCHYALRKLWLQAQPYGDVRNVTAAQVLRDCGPVDICTFPFPCQDISTAGPGEGITGKRSGLFFEVVRILSEMRGAGAPVPWLFAENVAAIKVRGIERVIASLEELGYQCFCNMVGAWAVGAPHRRNRLWLVGRLKDHQRHVADTGLSECTGRQSGTGGQQPATGRHGPARRIITSFGGISGNTGCTLGNATGSRSTYAGGGAGSGEQSNSGPQRRRITLRESSTASTNAGRIIRRRFGCPDISGTSGNTAGMPSSRRTTAYKPPVCPECCHATIDAGLAVSGPLCDGCAFYLAHTTVERQREPHDAASTQSRHEPRSGVSGGGPTLGDTDAAGLSQRQAQLGDHGQQPAQRTVRRRIGAFLPMGRDDVQLRIGTGEFDGERSALETSVPAVSQPWRYGDLPTNLGRGTFRWPAGPGCRQHDWERSRLAQFRDVRSVKQSMGFSVDELAGIIHERFSRGDVGISDQEIIKAAKAANKVMLRMLGNGWVFPLPVIIYRWIRDMINKEVETS